ncbi:Na(+)/H(+) antiporter subunit C [Saccharomonospora xinjiangensis]|uniref:Multisubunit Na+/H+ antiporter, MnhC subunit n=1 Tax=Saccharomonospora xinjiangensis XJ-54 TaxID=882086 RepID=I0UXQ4_9PSEU|nr:Na(+)/H(+) antiporter subunit C [Saccharomonospora xinjiangensis]EID52657.1 multisubunit Na+/H+ antiporter, MnhC subunit [Saccharomonospora xinjiangensis XJ-54]
MTINLTMAVAIAGLYAAGFYLLMQRSLMRVIIGITILGHGANLFLQVAGGPPGMPSFIGEAIPDLMVDPLPQALALTAIVITFALTTFLLALAFRSWVLLGHDEVQDDLEDRRVAVRRARAVEETASPDVAGPDTSGEAEEASEDAPDAPDAPEVSREATR